MKMNRKELFALMGKLDDRYIAASAYIAEGGEDIVYERPARRRAAAFFQSGWFVAILCAVVSLSVVGAMVWAGRQEPTVPPMGTTQESGTYDDRIRVEEETEVTVTVSKTVTVTVQDCTGQPYEIKYQPAVASYIAGGITHSGYQPPDSDYVVARLKLQDETHIICNPDLITNTFIISESMEEAVAYAEQLLTAVVHVGYDKEHLICNACGQALGASSLKEDETFSITTKDCMGNPCDVSYVVKIYLNYSGATEESHTRYYAYMISDYVIEYPEGTDQNIGNFFSTEELVETTKKHLSTALIHTEKSFKGQGATCVEEGYTAGKKCSACQKLFSGGEPIPATSDHLVYRYGSTCETCDLTATEGIKYISNGDGTCIVAGFEANAPDKTQAIIPRYSPEWELVVAVVEGAFEGCDSLTYVLLPDKMKSIGANAFANCPNLSLIYYSGIATQWKAVQKSDSWRDEAVTKVRCYRASVEASQ